MFGLSERSVRWMRIAFWLKEPSSRYVSWFRLASASTVKDDCTSCQRRPNFTLILCYRHWLQTARLICQLASFCNRTLRTVHMHTHYTHKTQGWVATELCGPECTGLCNKPLFCISCCLELIITCSTKCSRFGTLRCGPKQCKRILDYFSKSLLESPGNLFS